MNDEAIKYNSLYQEVELAIGNIASLGFDVSSLNNRLKEIHNTVSDNVTFGHVGAMAEASYIQSYSDGINKLNKLKNKLDNYDIYVRAANTCDHIKMKMKDEISTDELNKLISKMIYILKSINKSQTINYDDEKQIVEKIYETAYNLIKLEIINNGDSELYLYVKNEEANMSYFNNLVLKDVERIRLNDLENNLIKMKMYELGEAGIYSNYLDLGLIKLILLSENKVDLQSVIGKRLENLSIEISDNTKKLIEEYRNADSKRDKKLIIMSDLRIAKMNLKSRITSLVAAVMLFISGGVAVHFLGKGLEKYQYTYDTEYYSSVDNETNSKHDFGIYFGNSPQDTGKITVYNVSDDKKETIEYQLNNISLDSMDEYKEYVEENFDVADKNYDIEIKKYTKGNELLLELLILMTYVLCVGGTAGVNFYFEKINSLKRALHNKKMKQEELDKINEELISCINLLMDEINKDDDLRKKFAALYEENRFLFGDNFYLYERVNNDYDLEKLNKAKKLVRERNI